MLRFERGFRFRYILIARKRVELLVHSGCPLHAFDIACCRVLSSAGCERIPHSCSAQRPPSMDSRCLPLGHPLAILGPCFVVLYERAVPSGGDVGSSLFDGLTAVLGC